MTPCSPRFTRRGVKAITYCLARTDGGSVVITTSNRPANRICDHQWVGGMYRVPLCMTVSVSIWKRQNEACQWPAAGRDRYSCKVCTFWSWLLAACWCWMEREMVTPLSHILHSGEKCFKG